MDPTWPSKDLLEPLRRCAGCHDQCLGVTGEVVESGDQSLALSRLAAMVLRLGNGVSAWSPGAGARLFVSAVDDLADEVCIHRASGQRVAPWHRDARAQAVRTGMAPEFVMTAQAATHACGNIWGLRETLPPVQPHGPVSVVLLHEATTRHADARSVEAQSRLIARAGWTACDTALASSGALELELGLVQEARAAAVAALERIRAVEAELDDGTTFASADPHLVWMLTQGVSQFGLAPMQRLEHLADVLGAAGLRRPLSALGEERRSVVYHDPGILARRLGVLEAPRRLLDEAGLERREARTSGRLARSEGGLPAALREPTAVEVARLRVTELGATKADLIVTSGPVALMALRAGDAGATAQDLFILLDELARSERPR